ncbi:MAG: sensor histidine kinase [Gemmatimonadaceae bacterium]
MPSPTRSATLSSRARWTLGVLAFVVLLAAALGARVLYVVRVGAPREVARLLLGSLDVTHADVDAWVAARAEQAALLARIAGEEPALRDPRLAARGGAADPATRAAFAESFGAVLRSLDVREGGVAGAWVWDAAGALVAGRGSTLSPTPPAGPGDTAGPAVLTTRRPGGVFVDFVAPVLAGGARRGSLVLRVAPNDRSFTNLNATSRSNLDGRTALLARVGDSVVVAATGSYAPRTPAVRAWRWEDVPPYVRAAFGGSVERGFGAGLLLPRAAFAAEPLPSLGWVAVREYEAGAITRSLRTPLFMEEGLFGALALLAAGLVVAGLRAARHRREHALAQLRADFVSSVSHELRTPLTQIRMFAELLRKRALREPDESDRALRIIEKEAGRLSILVDNVLNYTRLRRGPRREAPRPTDVAEEVRQVIESFAPLAAERGVHVEEDVPVGLRAAVDAQALRQVLLNLLENAVKYGPRGQTVTVAARGVAGERGEAGRVRLWVDDEGPGIPPAERDAVWEAFYRGEWATRSAASGSGLGLAVVRRLVEHHGGTVAVEEAPGGGARMAVEVPAAEEAGGA